MAGVEDDKPPPKEDTLRETPAAKTERASIPDDWKPPPRRKELTTGTELGPSADLDVPAGGARVDVGFGDARVRSFQVKGPLAVLAGFVVFASRKAIAAQRDEPVRTGEAGLIGSIGEVREPLDPTGQVFVQGALWQAQASGEQLEKGRDR